MKENSFRGRFSVRVVSQFVYSYEKNSNSFCICSLNIFYVFCFIMFKVKREIKLMNVIFVGLNLQYKKENK